MPNPTPDPAPDPTRTSGADPLHTYAVHHPEIRKLIQPSYDHDQIHQIWSFLTENGTLQFTPLKTHLYPAAAAADAQNTGYQYVWVRDNVYVAYAHYLMGEYSEATATVSALMQYFQSIRGRFEAIAADPERRHQVMQRPHIRFDGQQLQELDEDWEQAQNDALGYFLWLYCTLALADETAALIELHLEAGEMLALFVRYFDAIRYWSDWDSGHWEEVRKISASSIGTVVAGLQALQQLQQQRPRELTKLSDRLADPPGLIPQLIEQGTQALNAILPWESRQPPQQARRYDSALLFLIFPLGVVNSEQAEMILADVGDRLTGAYGIQRYPDDSFWCRDFQDLDKSIQTAKYTQRQTWLKTHGRSVQRGEEAQWCIFDSILSALYGQRFQSHGQPHDLQRQTLHLNRALGQITGTGQQVVSHQGDEILEVNIPPCRCPELYYLQGDRYVPNVSTPLLWAQANLCIALTMMRRSLEH